MSGERPGREATGMEGPGHVRAGAFRLMLAAPGVIVSDPMRAQEATVTGTTRRTAATVHDDVHRERERERLKAAGMLSGSVYGNDIHAVVEKDIPRGSSLTNAAMLLRQTGGRIGPGYAPACGSGAAVDARCIATAPGMTFGISNENVIKLEPTTRRAPRE